MDLCCGSGAVSLELISRGHNPAKITMIDAGLWGDVWRLVGAGDFNLRTLELLAREVPVQSEKTADALVALRDEIPPSHSTLAPYVLLLLQSGRFGGAAVGTRGDRWWAHSFRRDLSRPLMVPHPAKLLQRMELICAKALGVTGIRQDIRLTETSGDVVAYIDPPYEGTAGYGHEVDPILWAAARYTPVYVSELRPLSLAFREIRSRITSSLSANAGDDPDRSEYLSLFNAHWSTPDCERAEQMSLLDQTMIPHGA